MRAAFGGASAWPASIAFLARHGVGSETLRRVSATAEASGAFAEQVLIREDWLCEDAFYRALAAELGVPFLDHPVRLAPEVRFPETCLRAAAPLANAEGPRLAIAPVRQALAWLLTAGRPLPPAVAITTPSRLNAAVLQAQAGEVVRHAARALAEAEPHRSCLTGCTHAQAVVAVAAFGLLVVGVLVEPEPTLTVVMCLSALLFLLMVTIRIAACRETAPIAVPSHAPRPSDRDLPLYTVIAPLYRERRVLARLIQGLASLDYPRAKLQVLLVIEADDVEMTTTLARTRLPGFCEVVVAPPGLPRTKPRALNIALPLAQGEFTVIYDAEDVPEPDQLRLAVATFATAPRDVVCLQARLVIDNTDDNWLTRGIR